MLPSILFLSTQPDQGRALLEVTDSASRVDRRDQYELQDLDLASYRAVIISMMADQRYLQSCAAQLDTYLQHGGWITVNGHIALPFLPELKPFKAIPNPSLDDFRLQAKNDHPVFAGIKVDELNRRRGVAGFWARGANPPPTGAQVLNTMKQGDVPVDWVYRRPGGGCLFMHSGNDMWVTALDDSINHKLFTQLLDWIGEGVQ
ncbi:MAG: hypothetical protein KUF74_03845 [Candidatus Thiodiazotropha sp. (ex Ctena orbiculata)]|nr:hypothetical protein [Candidatus Thiodiazotropha taylori]